MNEHALVFSSQNWETDVLGSPEPVLVDFWAEWCPPCRMIAPTIDALAQEYAGRARVGKLNVDQNAELAARYDVRAIPTLLLFRGGQVLDRRIGALPKSELASLLDRQLDPAAVA